MKVFRRIKKDKEGIVKESTYLQNFYWKYKRLKPLPHLLPPFFFSLSILLFPPPPSSSLTRRLPSLTLVTNDTRKNKEDQYNTGQKGLGYCSIVVNKQIRGNDRRFIWNLNSNNNFILFNWYIILKITKIYLFDNISVSDCHF